MRGREKLKIYAENDQGQVFVGIMGKYHCTPRWYKVFENPLGLEYIKWRGVRHYLLDLEDLREPK